MPESLPPRGAQRAPRERADGKSAASTPQFYFLFVTFDWMFGWFRPTAPVQRFYICVKTLNLCLPKTPSGVYVKHFCYRGALIELTIWPWIRYALRERRLSSRLPWSFLRATSSRLRRRYTRVYCSSVHLLKKYLWKLSFHMWTFYRFSRNCQTFGVQQKW